MICMKRERGVCLRGLLRAVLQQPRQTRLIYLYQEQSGDQEVTVRAKLRQNYEKEKKQFQINNSDEKR